MKKELDFDEDMRINVSALDIEWLNQASLSRLYGEYHSECLSRKRRAEEVIKVVRAQLSMKAIKYPDKYLGQGVKPTEKVVEAFYRTHPKHIEAKEEWLAACEECDSAEVAKWEISNTRKSTLEHLVKLLLANYFAGPNIPRNLKEEIEKSNAELTKRIGEKLKRTK